MDKKKPIEEFHCPNCGCVWDIEEIESQKCDGCGFPDNMDEEDLIDYYDEQEQDF